MDRSAFIRGLLAEPEPTQEQSFDPIGQSARDQIAAYFLGPQRPTPEQRKFVHGFLGSAGYGHDQLGVIDFVPFAGSALGLDEAVRDGSPKAAALHALGLVPRFWPRALAAGDAYSQLSAPDRRLFGVAPKVPITVMQSLIHSDVERAKKGEADK